MPYRFTNLTSATTYLTSLGFTVSSVMMNWITPLRSSSQRADLFYEGKEVGYLETPTDIQPDEDWCVNIPFEKRSIVPGGVLNAIFGNTEGNEGWENRQFYIETDHFTRFQFGSQLENIIEAQGPGSTIRLKSSSDVLELYKEVTENSEDAIIGINLPELAQQLRYVFVQITGSTLTGPLMLHDDPINNLQASTKQYVDGRIANHNIEHASAYLALTGGALTGTTTISVAPSGSTDITNKQYVDTTISNTIGDVLGARRQSHIIGDGVSTTYVIEHNFNSNFYFVNVIDTADMNEVTCAVQHTTLNTVTLFFDTAPAVDSMLVFLMR